MKKMFVLLATLFVSVGARADILGDQITASLINHVSAHSQWTTKGENRLALLADIVEIGKMDGATIGQLRFGFNAVTSNGNTTPSAGYVADAYINISPFIRKYVKFNPNWTFLNSVEIGPSYSYDFYQHHSYLAASVGLAFGLQPLK